MLARKRRNSSETNQDRHFTSHHLAMVPSLQMFSCSLVKTNTMIFFEQKTHRRVRLAVTGVDLLRENSAADWLVAGDMC